MKNLLLSHLMVVNIVIFCFSKKSCHLVTVFSFCICRCITIQYTAPVEDIFYRSKNLKASAEKILELITDLSLEENPIVFHVFSNGGGMLYRHISQLSKEKPEFQTIHIVGCIFDSLPSSRNPITAAKAFMSVIQGNFIIRYLAAALVCVLVFVLWAYNRVKLLIGTVDSDVDYWEYMAVEPVRWPYLYLYSKVDKLVSFKYIEKIISIRKSLGADVQSICWDDSPHVQHFKHHRETYILRCHEFITYCLRQK